MTEAIPGWKAFYYEGPFEEVNELLSSVIKGIVQGLGMPEILLKSIWGSFFPVHLLSRPGPCHCHISGIDFLRAKQVLMWSITIKSQETRETAFSVGPSHPCCSAMIPGESRTCSTHPSGLCSKQRLPRPWIASRFNPRSRFLSHIFAAAPSPLVLIKSKNRTTKTTQSPSHQHLIFLLLPL